MKISVANKLKTPENTALNIDDHISGFGLPRTFYTSARIYENDINYYWHNSWIWVGHITQIPKSGDFFVFDYGQESVIISRDREDQINAFMNVCRHRGSRVCTD